MQNWCFPHNIMSHNQTRHFNTARKQSIENRTETSKAARQTCAQFVSTKIQKRHIDTHNHILPSNPLFLECLPIMKHIKMGLATTHCSKKWVLRQMVCTKNHLDTKVQSIDTIFAKRVAHGIAPKFAKNFSNHYIYSAKMRWTSHQL